MKETKRTVYYCDFCKKKSMRRDTMELHEKHCTLNPNRECRLCGSDFVNTYDINFIKKNDIKLQKDNITGTGYTVIGVPELRKAVETLKERYECPICLFSILRQALGCEGLSEANFSLKEEMDKYWKEENEENMEDYY